MEIEEVIFYLGVDYSSLPYTPSCPGTKFYSMRKPSELSWSEMFRTNLELKLVLLSALNAAWESERNL